MTGPTGRTRSRLGRAVPPIVLGLIVLATWQSGLIHRLFDLKEYTLAYPRDIIEAVAGDGGSLIRHVRVTLVEALAGFAIGSALGLMMAIGIHAVPIAQRAVLPLVSSFAAMPVIALAPLMLLYFGRGILSKVAVIVIMTAPPMTVATFKGLSSVDADLENLLFSYAANRGDFLRRLRLPWALPFVFTGLKLNVTLSLIGAIIAEFFASDAGLGSQMSYALDTFDMPTAWGTMLLAGLLGVISYQVVSLIERVAVPWHVSIRERTT
jgi:NitT/TauT family transport system permease protein